MSWLKRILGTTDAVEDAREDAAADGGESTVGQSTASRPAGWGGVETSQDGDEVVISLQAPGLDEDSIALEPDGSLVKLRAKGSNEEGQQIR